MHTNSCQWPPLSSSQAASRRLQLKPSRHSDLLRVSIDTLNECARRTTKCRTEDHDIPVLLHACTRGVDGDEDRAKLPFYLIKSLEILSNRRAILAGGRDTQ